jgi:hypothetical protein
MLGGAMSDETIMVRGAESEIAQFHADLQSFLAEQEIKPGQLPLVGPASARRRLTDPPVLGHEAFLEIAIEIGKAVAVGTLTSALKDVVVSWIKAQARKRGLLTQTKGS